MEFTITATTQVILEDHEIEEIEQGHGDIREALRDMALDKGIELIRVLDCDIKIQ